MFSNLFKTIVSLSLLTAVSAVAQEARDRSEDLSRERDSQTQQHDAALGKTFETMTDQADKQRDQLRSVDPNSAAAKASELETRMKVEAPYNNRDRTVMSPKTTVFMYGNTMRLSSVHKKGFEKLTPAEYEKLKAEFEQKVAGYNSGYYPGVLLFDPAHNNNFLYTRYVNLFGSIGKVIAPVGTLGNIIKVKMRSSQGTASSDRLKIIDGDLVGKRLTGDINIGRVSQNLTITPIGSLFYGYDLYVVGYPFKLNGKIQTISYKDWSSPDAIQMIQGAGDPADKLIMTVEIAVP